MEEKYPAAAWRSPALSVSLLRRTEQRDGLPLVPAIDAKIFFVRGNNLVPRIQLAHTNQAHVSQVWSAVRIACSESVKIFHLAFTVKGNTDNVVAQHSQHYLA